MRDSFIIRSQGGSGWSRGGGWTRGSVRDCSAPALGVRNSGRRRRVGFGLRRPFSGGLARASSSLGAADGEGESRFRGRPVVAEVVGAGALLVRSGGWRRRVGFGLLRALLLRGKRGVWGCGGTFPAGGAGAPLTPLAQSSGRRRRKPSARSTCRGGGGRWCGLRACGGSFCGRRRRRKPGAGSTFCGGWRGSPPRSERRVEKAGRIRAAAGPFAAGEARSLGLRRDFSGRRCGRSPHSPRSEQRAEAGGGAQTHRGVVDA